MITWQVWQAVLYFRANAGIACVGLESATITTTIATPPINFFITPPFEQPFTRFAAGDSRLVHTRKGHAEGGPSTVGCESIP
jgi:hypothetical protein